MGFFSKKMNVYVADSAPSGNDIEPLQFKTIANREQSRLTNRVQSFGNMSVVFIFWIILVKTYQFFELKSLLLVFKSFIKFLINNITGSFIVFII